MFEGITAESLANILLQVAPVELEGLALLRQHRPQPGEIFPRAPIAQIVPATLQLMAYAQESYKMAEKLSKLKAVPLVAPVLEYGL